MKELDIIKNIKLLHSTKGIGDDAYILNLKNIKKTNLIVSVDAFYENIHFKLNWFTPQELGKRVAMAAISDIAAMGAKVKCLFNTISYNDKNTIEGVLKGIDDALKITGGYLSGGDLTGGRDLSISITVIGESQTPVKRSTANIKDKFFVTGYLGESALGLWCLKHNVHTEEAKYFIDKFKNPSAKLKKGFALLDANSLIDTSDGLLSELLHIAKSSKINIDIERLPVSNELIKFCKNNNLQWEDFVIYGGEDFELIYSYDKQILETDLYIGKALQPIFSKNNNKNFEQAKVFYKSKELLNKSFKHF